MIDVYQLTDALSAALLGMFGLWAAGSRRHWFVRTAVLGVVLLNMLLIPAYEVLIQFGIQVLVIIAGLAVWRRQRQRRALNSARDAGPPARFRPQFSLETLMLLMVVVAVVTAVAARAPRFAIYDWYQFLFVGGMPGVIALASVWVVCGETRWWMRLLAVPPLVFFLATVMRWLWISRWLLQHWMTSPSYVPQYWQGIMQEGIFSGAGYLMTVVPSS
jgi:hypothetical protein